ncbi:hypothetical protein D3C71_1729040 [compost metagenome]
MFSLVRCPPSDTNLTAGSLDPFISLIWFILKVFPHHHAVVATLLKVLEDTSKDAHIQRIRVLIRNHIEVIMHGMGSVVRPR